MFYRYQLCTVKNGEYFEMVNEAVKALISYLLIILSF